ncbi:hypothetical protein GCK72_022491 [Caenorhabditis remanei]|uniref:Uncharacterized protein n=1 Tax=Caenorhabditis remanei TaxID=31234 RepID=A0A6A5FTV3_CAERE|nr:hypothetical protein GCK72_022491 [Caenorhabditis remanei]KAF1746040.1 hypothetical protein GCK72_022491 [Caenorhabditis remanei]
MTSGAAIKDLMTKALATTVLEHLKETVLHDKIDSTDYQRTKMDIEDEIARESLISYLENLDSSHPDSGAPDGGPSTSSAVATSSRACDIIVVRISTTTLTTGQPTRLLSFESQVDVI